MYERLDRMSDAEQLTLARSIVNSGHLIGSPVDVLARSRSSLILPVIEQKIEEVLRSPDPLACFTQKPANLDRTIDLMVAVIAGTGTELALREASKLLKIDEKRFDHMVYRTLVARQGQFYGGDGRNAFALAYQGFEIGDPAVERRIIPWAEQYLAREVRWVGNPIYEGVRGTRREWAAALVERYGGVPSEAQWRADPIVSRLKPELPKALHNDVLRYAIEAVASGARK